MGVQGKPISPDYKKAIVSLKQYFDRTKNDCAEKSLSSIVKTAHALDIGPASVNRVMADYNRDPSSIEIDKFNRGHPPRIISESLQSYVRDYVRAANHAGKYITLDMLSEYLSTHNKAGDFSTRTLGRALDRWGFIVFQINIFTFYFPVTASSL